MSGPPPAGRAPRRALVVGTGLIGGSLGTGLRRRGWHVTGHDADAEQAERALEVGAIDEIGQGLDAELVFIATPVAAAVAVATAILAEPGLPFSLVFRSEPGREDVLLNIAAAYETASRRRIPPPDFGPI